MNIQLTVILLVLIFQLGILMYAGLKFVGFVRKQEARIIEFIEQIRSFSLPDEKTGFSPAAMLADRISEQFAQILIDKAKGTFMGMRSGQVRADHAVEADIAEGVISARYPWLGPILKAFPSLQKTLRRNPDLVGMAVEKLGSVMAPKHVPGNDHDNELMSQQEFKL